MNFYMRVSLDERKEEKKKSRESRRSTGGCKHQKEKNKSERKKTTEKLYKEMFFSHKLRALKTNKFIVLNK